MSDEPDQWIERLAISASSMVIDGEKLSGGSVFNWAVRAVMYVGKPLLKSSTLCPLGGFLPSAGNSGLEIGRMAEIQYFPSLVRPWKV